MSDYQNINYSVTNRVATIALNSPEKLNAFNQKMRFELIDAVQKAEDDVNIRVVILTGEGKAFSAGADLTEGSLGDVCFVEQCKTEYTPWLMGIHNSKKIYIAAVNGACAGIGSAAALNCDLIVMGENAYLYQAFSAIGLMPDGGAVWLLLQKLGYQKALEMAIDAGKLSAEECLKLGIANRIVADDKLMIEAQAWAEKIANGAPLAQAAAKQLMRKASQMTYHDVVVEESNMQNKLIKSQDAQNAVKAFFSKTTAVFEGK